MRELAIRVRRSLARLLFEGAWKLDCEEVTKLAMARINNFDVKYDPARVAKAVTARLAAMISAESYILPVLEKLELRVKAFANHTSGATAITSIQLPFYYNFARQCWASLRTHKGGTIADMELAALIAWWESQGCDDANCTGILLQCLGYRAPAP